MGVVAGRATAGTGVAVMAAAGVHARASSLTWLVVAGTVLVVSGLVACWRAHPAAEVAPAAHRPAWRFPAAGGAVALATYLAAAPVLVHLHTRGPGLWPAAVGGVVLAQACLLGHLDRALGRRGHEPRHRLVTSVAASSLGTTTATLASLAQGLEGTRWPALLDAVAVAVVCLAGARTGRPGTATDVGRLVSAGEAAGGE